MDFQMDGSDKKETKQNYWVEYGTKKISGTKKGSTKIF